MNKIISFIIIGLFFQGFLMPGSTKAEGAYFSLKGGFHLGGNMDVSDQFSVIQIFPTPDIPQTFDFKKSLTASIAVGNTFGRFRLEAEGFYSNAKFDVIDRMAATAPGEGSVVALMANAYIDLLEGGNGALYFGVGIGYAETKLKTFTTGEGIAFQAIAGFEMNLIDSVGIGIEYRYFNSKTGGTFDNFKSSNVMVSYFYAF
jgi:opacity protein-like surface antigen